MQRHQTSRDSFRLRKKTTAASLADALVLTIEGLERAIKELEAWRLGVNAVGKRLVVDSDVPGLKSLAVKSREWC